MRYLLLCFVILLGCKEPLPEEYHYTPMVSVLSASLLLGAPVSPVDPDVLVDYRDCTECGGKGWKGDGQPRSDCLSCTHSKWDDHVFEAIPPPEDIPDIGCTNHVCDCEQCECDPCECGQDASPGDIEWFVLKDPSLTEAKAAAKESGKNLLLVFASRTECAACITQEKEVFSSQEVIRYLNERTLPTWVDYGRYPELAEAWCTWTKAGEVVHPQYPSTVFVSTKGLRKVGVGLVTEASFLGFLNQCFEELE